MAAAGSRSTCPSVYPSRARQAGRAFYIDGGSGGRIVQIDEACTADDAARVDLHLNGTGMCRIDLDDDRSMAIYTHHLARFGTAESGSGAPPAVRHTCSVGIGSPSPDIGDVAPGGRPDPAEQTLINYGSAQFAQVGIEASPVAGHIERRRLAGRGTPVPAGPRKRDGRGQGIECPCRARLRFHSGRRNRGGRGGQGGRLRGRRRGDGRGIRSRRRRRRIAAVQAEPGPIRRGRGRRPRPDRLVQRPVQPAIAGRGPGPARQALLGRERCQRGGHNRPLPPACQDGSLFWGL